MQGWYRRGSQKKRKMENKKVRNSIGIERIELFMYLVAVLCIAIVAVLFVTLFVLTKYDWMIAILSATMLVISVPAKKLDPYIKLGILSVAATILVYLLVMTLNTKITPVLNENISRYVSAGCLVITFIAELYRAYKEMKKNSKAKIDAFKKKIK